MKKFTGTSISWLSFYAPRTIMTQLNSNVWSLQLTSDFDVAWGPGLDLNTFVRFLFVQGAALKHLFHGQRNCHSARWIISACLN